MYEIPYYHGVIKNTVLAFGAIFRNLKILRQYTDGEVGQTVAVPITYGPKEKVLVRLRQGPDFENQVMVTLPRMAFEITGFNYDASRMQNRNQKITCLKPDGSVIGVFSPVPYNLSISLYLLTKGAEDSLGVLEQILPTFTPEYTARITTIPEMNITQDVPFILNSVSSMDDFEGDFSTRRLVTHTLDFTAKINLYGPSGDANIITRTDTDIKNLSGTTTLRTHVSEGDVSTGEITADFWT